jgi:hypothetical protein
MRCWRCAPSSTTQPLVKDGKPAYKLSVNDMVIKALALALRDVPDANVSWTDQNMVKHKHADVGVAVSIPGGLITPIVRKAELKSLSAISNEMKDLGKRAKEPQAEAGRISGRHHCRVQHGHDGRQELRGRRQPAACDDPGGRRGRGAGRGQEQADGHRQCDDGHALDRPSRASTARSATSPNCSAPSSATSKRARWADAGLTKRR